MPTLNTVNGVTGTFTAADQISAELFLDCSADLSIIIPDTGGTVKLQRWMNGEWRDIPEGEWTESTEDIVSAGSSGTDYRLVCTAWTADIRYQLR